MPVKKVRKITGASQYDEALVEQFIGNGGVTQCLPSKAWRFSGQKSSTQFPEPLPKIKWRRAKHYPRY